VNKTEHLLSCLIEECAEVQKAAAKALRFGLNSINPGTNFSNEQEVIKEFAEVVAVMELLEDEGIFKSMGSIQTIESKKARVLHFMQYAIKEGILDADREKTGK
jgi:NTP pyrophosphatase (non-canonical NTP hydrolase)